MSKYKFISASLSLLLLVASFSSCQKDEVTSKPILLSFGPSTVKHGETISFIGKGLDQISEVIMPANISIPASSFTAHTSTRIDLAVPQESTVGYVKLMTSKGDSIISKTMFGAAYTIAVRSYTPATARPGTNITINGDFLNYVKQVTFAEKQTVTQFVSQSIHQLVVQVPRSAQTGPISLSDLATTPQIVDQDTLANDLVLNVTLPVATGLTPSTGVEQTKNLTITGTDLDLVTEIDFAGLTASGVSVVAPFVSQSTTQIVVTVPKTSVTGPLSLLVPSGVKVATSSVTILEPAVTAMTTGRAGTENVTITGTSLDLVASIAFPGGATVTSFVNQASDGTSIEVAIPASAIPGALQITSTHSFVVNVPGFKITLPVATNYSTTAAGAPMTITGTDLDLVASIIFPDKTSVASSSFTTQTSTSINVTIPATSTSVGALIFVLTNGYHASQGLAFGGCSTYFANGTVLYDFSSDSQMADWGTQVGSGSETKLTATNYDNSDGHSCVGQLTVTMPIASAGTNFEHDFWPVPDYTGKTKIHFWIKIEVADPSTMNGIQAFAQPNWGWYAPQWTSGVFDGQWHEIVLDLSGISSSNITAMDRIGLQILSSVDGTQATIHIDDVWVE